MRSASRRAPAGYGGPIPSRDRFDDDLQLSLGVGVVQGGVKVGAVEYTSGAKRAKIAPRTPDHFQLAAFVERVEDQLLRRIRLGVVILKGADQVGAQSEAVAEGLSVLPRLRIRLGIGRLAGDMCTSYP